MATQGFDLMSLVPLLIVGIFMSIGLNIVAGRLGKNRWIWTILSIIPFVNFFFYVYAYFAIIIYVLDKLNALSGALMPANTQGRS